MISETLRGRHQTRKILLCKSYNRQIFRTETGRVTFARYQRETLMELREKAAALATKQAGRCTCALMDDGLDCPWCEVFYDVLQGYPPSPRPSGGACPETGRAHSIVLQA